MVRRWIYLPPSPSWAVLVWGARLDVTRGLWKKLPLELKGKAKPHVGYDPAGLEN